MKKNEEIEDMKNKIFKKKIKVMLRTIAIWRKKQDVT